MNKLSSSVALAVVLASGAGPTLAQSSANRNTVSTIVQYGDLNLANAQGARTMLTRIKAAARRVCEPWPSTVFEYADWRNCIAKATNSAVARLDAPTVTAAYGGRRASSVLLAQSSSR